MFPNLKLPIACVAIAILSFFLSWFLPQSQADSITQWGTQVSAQGAQCCYDPTASCGVSYGCQPRSVRCGEPFNVDCVLWNCTDIIAIGRCKNGFPTNCAQYNPFYCAAGPLYTDPNNTGQCISTNKQCDGYIPAGTGCAYDSSNNCTI